MPAGRGDEGGDWRPVGEGHRERRGGVPLDIWKKASLTEQSQPRNVGKLGQVSGLKLDWSTPSLPGVGHQRQA